MKGKIDDNYLFHTSGPNCHWCAAGLTRYVWGPYRTNIREHCESLIEQGRHWEVPETVAASITVRDNWLASIDPEEWREREHGLIAHWLTIRTDRMEVPLVA